MKLHPKSNFPPQLVAVMEQSCLAKATRSHPQGKLHKWVQHCNAFKKDTNEQFSHILLDLQDGKI